MDVRSCLFKILSAFVVFAMIFASFGTAFAQEGGPETPTAEPTVTIENPVTPTAPAPADLASPPPTATPESTAEPTLVPTIASFAVTGKVSGLDGKPLAGVTVFDDQGHQTSTAADGAYTLSDLPVGKYLVRAKQAGKTFLPYYRVVKITDGDVTGVDFYPSAGSKPIHVSPDVNHPKPLTKESTSGSGDLSGQSMFSTGQAGLTFRYDRQIGVTGEPYLPEATDHIQHLNSPAGLAIDSSGGLVVAEERGEQVVRFDASGNPNFAVGKPGVIAQGEYYSFTAPRALAFDPNYSNYLWVVDGNRLERYDLSLGNDQQYVPDYQMDGNTFPDDYKVSEIRGIAFNNYSDDAARMFLTDRFNHRIMEYRFNLDGNPEVASIIDGRFDSLHLGELGDIIYDPSSGYLYVADSSNNRIAICEDAGACNTAISNTGLGINPDDPAGHLNYPTSMAINGNILYVADAGLNRILACDLQQQTCTHFAGVAGEPGSDDVHFSWIDCVRVDGAGNVYVSDQDNHRVEIFDSSGNKIGQRGIFGEPYLTDGGHLNAPWGLAVDQNDGSLYVTESRGYTLSKYDGSGAFQWRSGQPGVFGSQIGRLGDGSAFQGSPAVDAQGHIYVPDTGNHRIVIYSPGDGSVYDTWGSYGTDNDHFNCPSGVSIHPSTGDIYILDRCNQRVQVFDSHRHYKATIGETGVTGGDSSHFNWPLGIAVDSAGNVYVADYGNWRVQKCWQVGSSYRCESFAEAPDRWYFAAMNSPISVAVGQDGLVYVSEESGNRVRVFDPSGAFRAKLGGDSGAGTGNLNSPSGVAVGGDGAVYVADREGARVVKYTRGVPGWSQLNVDGWGIDRQLVASFEMFNGKLYASTRATDGIPFLAGQIQRFNADGSWAKTAPDGLGDIGNRKINAMAVFQGSLYAATGHDPVDNTPEGPQIWRSSDGTTWSQLPLPETFKDNEKEFYRLWVFGDKLYAGVRSDEYGMDSIWRCPKNCSSADDWEQFGENIFGYGLDQDVVDFAINQNVLYLGMAYVQGGDYYSGGRVWSTTDGNLWKEITNSNFSNDNGGALTGLAVMTQDGKDYLYTSLTGVSGPQVLRCELPDCKMWAKVVTNGFGLSADSQVRKLIVIGENLYAVVQTPKVGVQVFSSSDGVAWTAVMNDVASGFGNSLNDYIVSPAAVTVFDNRLLIGATYASAWYYSQGGRVWISDPLAFNTISGTITPKGTLPDGVTLDSIKLTLQPGGRTVAPNGAGAYAVDHLVNGTYTITPARDGCSFSPASAPVNVDGSDVSAVNFTVACAAVHLIAPTDGSLLTSLDPVILAWEALPGAKAYTLQIATSADFKSGLKTVVQSMTNYQFTGLSAGKTYYWRVKQSSPTVGASSVAWSFKTPIQPAAPILIAPANGALLPYQPYEYYLALTWRAVIPGAGRAAIAHYQVQASHQSTFATLEVDEYTQDISRLTMAVQMKPNQIIYWRVRAIDAANIAGLWSSVRTVKTLPGPMYLDVVMDKNTLLPTFFWHDQWEFAGTGKYSIQICKVSGKNCTLVVSATTNVMHYTLTKPLQASTNYKWRVQAVGINGNGPFTGYWGWLTPNALPAPALLSPLANEAIPDAANPTYLPTFSWKSTKTINTIQAHYRLEVSKQADFDPKATWAVELIDPNPDGVIPTLSPTYTPTADQELLPNTIYFWRVRSCDFTGCGLWPAGRKLITKPVKPSPVVASNPDSTLDYTFSWKEESKVPATSYTLQVCSNTTCSPALKNVTTPTTSAALTLPANTNVWWRVEGNGLAGSPSDWAAGDAFTTINPPGVPVLVSPAVNAVIVNPDQPISFTWIGSDRAASHELQVDARPTFEDPEVDVVPDAIPYAVTWKAGTFYWRVRSRDGDGNWSAWSATRKGMTRPWVSGRVEDMSGAPIDTARLKISNKKDYWTASVDDNGEYSFPPLSPGNYTLTVKEDNYLTFTQSITLVNGGSYYGNIHLVDPSPSAGAYRVVLSWDEWSKVRDLDLHLWLPKSPDASQEGHIFDLNPGKPNSTSPAAWMTYFDRYSPFEVLDFVPTANGKYVVGAMEKEGTTYSWASALARVDIYQGTTLVKSCSAPSGNARWWYVMDANVSGANHDLVTFACKNKAQPSSPAPFADETISGKVTQTNGRPLQNVTLDDGISSVPMGSPFTLTGFGPTPARAVPLKVTITPQKTGWTFDPPSQPSAPGSTNVSFLATPDGIEQGGAHNAVAVRGDYAFLGSGGRLDILNIRDKSNPTLVTSFWIAEQEITAILLKDDYAYVSEGDGGLNILDISDPAVPRFVGLYPGGSMHAAVDGQYAYVSTYDRFSFVDIRDPSKPHVVSEVTFPVYRSNQVALNGRYAYMLWANLLYIFDVKDPSHPVKLSILDVTVTGAGAPFDFLIHDGHILIIGTQGLGVFDLNPQDPAHPIKRSFYSFGNQTLTAAAGGDILYVADDSGKLTLYDMSHPSESLPELGSYSGLGLVSTLAGQDAFAYLADDSDTPFKIIDAAYMKGIEAKGTYIPAP